MIQRYNKKQHQGDAVKEEGETDGDDEGKDDYQKSNNGHNDKDNSSKSYNETKDEEEDEKSKETKITFFLRPYLTFLLSNQSMLSFEENFNRTNATSKFMDLISFSDYSLFEMIVNAHIIGKTRLKIFLSNLSYRYTEIINYLLIVLHNIILIIHFYQPPQTDISIY